MVAAAEILGRVRVECLMQKADRRFFEDRFVKSGFNIQANAAYGLAMAPLNAGGNSLDVGADHNFHVCSK